MSVSTFEDLLTQLSSEYERVENALADALAELRARRGEDVRADACAGLTSSGGSTRDNLLEATGSSGDSFVESLNSQDGGQSRPKQLQDSDDEGGEEGQEAHEEECARDRSRSREPTQFTGDEKLDTVAEHGPGIALFRGGLLGSLLESTASQGGGDFRQKHLQDLVEDKEEEDEAEEKEDEEHRKALEQGRSWSPEPILERVADEGPGREVFRGAAANMYSNRPSGPLGRAPTDRTIAHYSHGRNHKTSGLSVRLPLTGGVPEGAMRCQATRPESERTQENWQTTMKVQDCCSQCLPVSSIVEQASTTNKHDAYEEETLRRSMRSGANGQFTSPPPPQGVKAGISQACAHIVPGAGAERAEPYWNGATSVKSYRDDAMPGRRRSLRGFQPAASRWAINPDHSDALEKWDQIMIVALTYVAVVTPVQVSMMETKFDAMLVIDCVVDLIFLCDIVLQFFLMYPRRTNGVYSLESRHSQIVAHYLKTWFAIDILSTVPFDLFAVMSDFAGERGLKLVKAMRLLKMLKLMKVLRASRVFHRLETRMSITYGKLALLKFFVLLFGITHWLANLWAVTLFLVDESEGIPRWVDALTELEANVEVKTKDSLAKLYLACLYFTSYTITSVGYGDIGPQNISERVVLTFIVMVSGISWAVVLGQVCGIVANLAKEEQAFRSTMDELNAMMQDRRIPRSMRTRLRSFFLSNKSAQKKAFHLNIVSAMSPGLRAEVSWEINRFWLERVKFLRPFLEEVPEDQDEGISRSFRPFVFDMSVMMQQVVHAQGEAFGVKHTMYILNRGLVDRLNQVFRSGSVWGSDFVLSDLRLLEPVDAYALTYIELTTLSRRHFFDLVQRHSRSFPEIYRTVRRYCCWLAFQRALLLEARRRQEVLRARMMEMPTTSECGASPFRQPPAPPLTT